MKKVNLFIGTLSNGGAERVVSNISLNLNKDIARKIILFGSKSKIEYPYDGELLYLDKNSQNNIILKLQNLFNRIIKIKEIKKENPNIVTISFLEYPNLLNSLTSKYGRTIVSVRNHMSTKHAKGLKALLWNLTIRYLYPRAEFIIVVSEEIKRDLIYRYKIPVEKIKIIYNSYNLKDIENMAMMTLLDSEVDLFKYPVIITAGRLNKQKGHWHLIRAFKEVKNSVKEAKLVILGEGELKGYLEKLTDELNLISDVKFLGFKKNPYKYFLNSKIFVLSSFYEGFPNVLAEAMACNLPVIATDCPSGPREILAPNEGVNIAISYETNTYRFGFLIPICDGKMYNASDPLTEEELKMANSIITLLKNDSIRKEYSKRSRERIQRFNVDNIIREWENLL
ncbi:MAG: glycosyltransferase [Bacilli bacterium]